MNITSKLHSNIFTLEETTEWKRGLSLLPLNHEDIYYTPEYYSIYESKGEGKAMCFALEEDDKIIIYPFLLNEINKLGYNLESTYYDIQGAYGYNGPISNTNDQDFLSKFSSLFCKFCQEFNIVAEFTRFNPLLSNYNQLTHIVPINANDVINVDLDIEKEEIWMKSYRKSVRQIINKCIKIGFEEKLMLIGEATNKDMEDFTSIYYSTLDRNMAQQFYYFNNEYIFNIRERLPKNVLLATIYYENKPVATSINPFMNVNAYGFLGGSTNLFKKESPFTYMLHKVIMKLKDFGVSNYLLGGGIERKDNIFNYKLSLSRNGLMDFYIGKKVHNRLIYNSIIEQWKAHHPESFHSHNNKILGYREI